MDQLPRSVEQPQTSFLVMVRCFCVVVAFSSIAWAYRLPLDEPGADALVRNALAVWDVPGCSVVVVNRDRVLYLRGHGVRTVGRTDPVSADTIFPIASCTKAFTATLVGQLADEGLIQWDDPVRNHLPRFKLSDPIANAGVMIRDLLCHRTGLASHDFLWYRSPLTQVELVHRAGQLPASKPFRTAFQYQSIMVSAAGLASAKAANQPWDQLLQQKLLAPLDMRSTSCVTPTSGELATPHRRDAHGRSIVIARYAQDAPNPSGSIHSTARDIGNWLRFQLGDGQWQDKRLISKENLAETHTPQMVQRLDGVTAATHPETTMMSYGLGWVIQDYRGQLLWTHTGMIDGFRAQIAVAHKSGLAIAVLSNCHETRMNLALVNSFLDRLLDLPPRDWNTYLKKVVAREEELAREARTVRDRNRRPGPAPRPLSDYVGRYENSAYGTVELAMMNNSLRFQWNSFNGPLTYHHGDIFELEIADLQEPLVQFNERLSEFQLFGVTFVRR